MINKTISDNIIDLSENEIFVFGSNLKGIHGKGGAKTALKWGAIIGQSKGLQGRTYAIPTKDKTIWNTLPLGTIKRYVDDFIEFAKQNKDLTFLVTEIGTGLATHKKEDIAPLFIDAIKLDNIHLSKDFWKILNKE